MEIIKEINFKFKMFVLAALLFSLSPVALLVGLINPRWVLLGENPTRIKSSAVYSGVFVISLVVAAFTVPPETKQADRSVDQPTQPSVKASTTPKVSAPEPSISPEAQVQKPSPSPLTQPSVLVSPQTTERISVNGAGLGDTREGFEKLYGRNISGNRELGRYQGDYIHSSYADEKIMSVALQFGKTDKKRRTKQEAVELAKAFLPSDLTRIKELQLRPDSFAIHYESQKLASAFPRNWQEVFWEDGVKPGSFLVIFAYDNGNPDSVFSVDIVAGDPSNL